MKTRLASKTACHRDAAALALSLLFALLAFSCGYSQTVPPLVNYQGRLSNPDGSPLPTADYTLTFNLYDAATNGSLVWGPQVFDGAAAQGHGARIPVVQGYFNVMLGPVDTNGRSLADAFNGTNRFVEITISNRPPIAPRQQILSAPFALRAARAAMVESNGVNTAALAEGAVTFVKLAPLEIGTNVGVGGLARSVITTQTVASTTFVNVPELEVTLQTSGRPVEVFLSTGEPPGESVFRASYVSTGPRSDANVRAVRNGTPLHQLSVGASGNTDVNYPPDCLRWIDYPGPGQHTYRLETFSYHSNGRLYFTNVRLYAREL